jgi:hypothetical protein
MGGNMENELVNNDQWALPIEAQATAFAGFLAVAGMKMLVVSFSEHPFKCVFWQRV